MLKSLAVILFVVFQVPAYASETAQPSAKCDSSAFNTRCIFKPGCYEITDYNSCINNAKKCTWDELNNYCKPSHHREL